MILLHLLWWEDVWPCTRDALLGQPAVHPLSRLDRPAVTHHAVKPWAGVFEMWQHNQFPWFIVTPKRRVCWVTRQLKEESRRGEWWRQQSADVYGRGDSSSVSGCHHLYDPAGDITIMGDIIDPGGRIAVSLENVQRNVRVKAACCDFNSASC